MKIADWMKREVWSVKPLDSIRHAREIMEEHRINQLPVVVEGAVVGIVTDRDLRDAFPSVFESPGLGRARQARSVADPSAIVVESVMSSNVVKLGPNDDIVAAARLMRRERIGALPIVERDRLIGILTRSDILNAFVALAEGTPR